MTWDDLDRLDKHIIYSLQEDSRGASSNDVAEGMGVSSSTVRNRIKQLEKRGILNGYRVDVDWEEAGSQLYTLIVCTAPIPTREELARKALEVGGVVHVREVMTGEQNVHLGVVGTDSDDLTRIGRELDELGLEVNDEDLIRNEYTHPHHGFESAEQSPE